MDAKKDKNLGIAYVIIMTIVTIAVIALFT